MLKYLSPTSLNIFETDPEAFYNNYVLKKPRPPQTEPMAVGGAFDAFVKNYVNNHFNPNDSIFEELFNAQVSEHNRDIAYKAGEECFNFYKYSGSLDKIVSIMDEPPIMDGRFNLINNQTPIYGIPDFLFTHTSSLKKKKIVFDLKVSGYYSQASPSRGHLEHKDAVLGIFGDIYYDMSHSFEQNKRQWATQLHTYGLLFDSPDSLVMIDQIYRSRSGELKLAKYRSYLSDPFKQEVEERYHNAWNMIKKGHYFPNLSFEDSQGKCRILEMLS